MLKAQGSEAILAEVRGKGRFKMCGRQSLGNGWMLRYGYRPRVPEANHRANHGHGGFEETFSGYPSAGRVQTVSYDVL